MLNCRGKKLVVKHILNMKMLTYPVNAVHHVGNIEMLHIPVTTRKSYTEAIIFICTIQCRAQVRQEC